MVPVDDSILVNLRRGTLEYCVLGLLSSERSYGLDIARRLTVDGLLLSSEGTLYPLLSRLRKAGWVETSWEESASGPPRRYYEITASGRRALAGFHDTWQPFRDAVDAVTSPSVTADPAFLSVDPTPSTDEPSRPSNEPSPTSAESNGDLP